MNCLRLLANKPRIELQSAVAPCLACCGQLRIVREVANNRFDRIEDRVRNRRDEAEWFAFLKADSARTRKAPGHCEGKRQRIRLDESFDRYDLILHGVG